MGGIVTKTKVLRKKMEISNQKLLQDLQETLYAEIPLTKQLGLRVKNYNGHLLSLTAPLEPNVNHKQTAFAGSLSAVATLAGWSLLWLILKEEKIRAKIVIQDSTIQYRQPVTSDFVALCARPTDEQIHRFTTTLQKRGVARLELNAYICNEEDCDLPEGKKPLSFAGRYVAQKI